MGSPFESVCDLLCISASKANEYLCAAKLMERNNNYKTMGPNKSGWGTLKSEYGPAIELEPASDIRHPGKRMDAMRTGSLCDDSPTAFTTKQQARNQID